MNYVAVGFAVTLGVYACKGLLELIAYLTKTLVKLLTIAIAKYKIKRTIKKMVENMKGEQK